MWLWSLALIAGILACLVTAIVLTVSPSREGGHDKEQPLGLSDVLIIGAALVAAESIVLQTQRFLPSLIPLGIAVVVDPAFWRSSLAQAISGLTLATVLGPLIARFIAWTWLDFTIVLATLLLAAWLAGQAGRHGGIRVGTACLVLGLLAGWTGWSVLERSRMAGPILQRPERSQPDGRRPIAVTLSGGGLRAAVFHAGVLATLGQTMTVSALSTVSGGSLIGGFVAAGGTPQEFEARIVRGQLSIPREALTIFSLPRLLAGAPIPRTGLRIWPVQYNRTLLLAHQLERAFLGDVSIDALQTPLLLVGMSDVIRSQAVGVSASGTIALPLKSSVLRLTGLADAQTANSQPWMAPADLSGTKASLLVAASAAPVRFSALMSQR